MAIGFDTGMDTHWGLCVEHLLVDNCPNIHIKKAVATSQITSGLQILFCKNENWFHTTSDTEWGLCVEHIHLNNQCLLTFHNWDTIMCFWFWDRNDNLRVQLTICKTICKMLVVCHMSPQAVTSHDSNRAPVQNTGHGSDTIAT